MSDIVKKSFSRPGYYEIFRSFLLKSLILILNCSLYHVVFQGHTILTVFLFASKMCHILWAILFFSKGRRLKMRYLFWISHPTWQLGSLSKRDTAFWNKFQALWHPNKKGWQHQGNLPPQQIFCMLVNQFQSNA